MVVTESMAQQWSHALFSCFYKLTFKLIWHRAGRCLYPISYYWNDKQKNFSHTDLWTHVPEVLTCSQHLLFFPNMPLIHPDSVYPYISNLRNHWISAFSDPISLNTNIKEEELDQDQFLQNSARAKQYPLVNRTASRLVNNACGK